MKFTTKMFQTGNNTGVPVPAEVVEALGGGRRPAVSVLVNGYAYRSTIASMGGQFLIPFSADKRRESGISGGDSIEVELALDTAPRTVEPPADLAAALAAVPGAGAAFRALSPSRQKAHVTSIDDAKTDATRQRRITKVVEELTRC
ncbi:YdeI/OmpD-associated family protein [Streptomyces sp. ME02-8801-2C]|uniref:YdeI/OmpD-associated family protein n=1 Tax=Streptomyces sp. ME02-8801-2C TaxID=3028680 RepID=UPI0029A91C46|nr:YdeI/OmpD-associated family protein [Streptomyces sp. ME02-8801-2C]MDX3458567.1 YdeI/OmpD-associated family protein [Streptomyces sp. ME02-8801-2C]